MKFVLVLSVLLAACQPVPKRAGLDDDLARIDSLVQAAYQTGATAGLGVGVVVDGRLEYTAHLGYADATAGIPADERTLWYTSSTSKSFTGFGVALLADRGLVELDAPISTYLPDAQWPPGVDPADLTVADFLGHTHGLGNGPLVYSAAFTGSFPESEFPRLLQHNVPRERTLSYSNLGYNVASMVINSVHPAGWKDFLENEVFAPAGLIEIHHRVSGLDPARIAKPHDLGPGGFRALPFVKTDLTMNAAGGHLGTIRDLSRWAIVQMDRGRLDGRQVFPESAVILGQQPLRTHDRQFAQFQRDAWGMGWDIGSYEGEPMVSRFGGYQSTRSHLGFLPGQRVGVVAMANGPVGSRLTDIIASFTYDVMMDRPGADERAAERLEEVREIVAAIPDDQARFQEVQRSRARPFPQPLSYYAGVYENDVMGHLAFVQVGDTLRMSWGVLEGPTTVYSAENHALRHELMGSGGIARFIPGPGHAQAVEVDGFAVPFKEAR